MEQPDGRTWRESPSQQHAGFFSLDMIVVDLDDDNSPQRGEAARPATMLDLDDASSTQGGEDDRPASVLTTLSHKLSLASEPTCVICFSRPREVTLQPCGHDKFCKECAPNFQRCPLCRQNLASATTADGLRIAAPRPSSETEPAITQRRRRVWPDNIRRWLRWFTEPGLDWKSCIAAFLALAVLSVFTVTWGSCRASADDDHALHFENDQRYPRSWWLGDVSSQGWGRIIAVAVGLGAAIRILFFYCMWRSARDAEERRMRRRGVVVFAISVIATLARSLILDEHYLNQPRAYSIYRTPSACGAQDPVTPVSSWIGRDNVEYCIYNSTWREATVYVATSSNEYTPSCAAFSADSAVLDLWECKARLGEVMCPICRPFGKGQDLCDRLSWLLGGKFGALYRLAAFMNIGTDIGVMILLASGRRELIASGFFVCLIFLQLALLLPVAHFSHGGCLQVTNPLGLKLHIVQDAVHALGSIVQSWVFAFFLILILEVYAIGIFFGAYLGLFMILCVVVVLLCLAQVFARVTYGRMAWLSRVSRVLGDFVEDKLMRYLSQVYVWLALIITPGLWLAWGVVILLLGSLCGLEVLPTCLFRWTDAAEASAVVHGFVIAFDVSAKFMAIAALHGPCDQCFVFVTSHLHHPGEERPTTIGRTTSEEA